MYSKYQDGLAIQAFYKCTWVFLKTYFLVSKAIPVHTDGTLKQSGPDFDRQCQTSAKQRGVTITSEDFGQSNAI